MLTCKEVTHVLSESQDRKLAFNEQVNLRLHLAMCKGCRRYEKQIQLIRRACKVFFGDARDSH